MSKYSISDASHLTTLETHFKDNLYVGGNFPNAEDALLFEQYATSGSEPCQSSHPNLWSWFALISLYTPPVKESWKAVAPVQKAQPKKEAPKKEEPKKEAPKAEVKPKAEAKADDLDLFGDDNEEDAAALEAMKKKKQEEKKKEKKKEEVVQKSLVLLEVKVWDPEQDYDALARKILTIEKDGLFWKTEYQLQEVAYGVKKIVIGMVVEDEKVSVDDIIDEMQSWEDEVQSVDIIGFNKI
jgi:elongation factor 1-beta